ncbi:MAG: sulfur carrier protein ThiS [Pseudomonadota bacterium]
MRIEVNGEAQDVAAVTLDGVLRELGFDSPAIATAVNGAFVAKSARAAQALQDGDRVEVLAPMQGG